MYKNYLSEETPVALKIAFFLPFLGILAMAIFLFCFAFDKFYTLHKIKNYNEDIYQTYNNFITNKNNTVWIKGIPVDYIKVEQTDKSISYAFPVPLKSFHGFSQDQIRATPFTIMKYVYDDFVNNDFKSGEISKIIINNKEIDMKKFFKTMAREEAEKNIYFNLYPDLEKAKNIKISLIKSGAENNE